MLKFYSRFFLATIGLFWLTSCEDVIVLPEDESAGLVVRGIFSDEKNGLNVFVFEPKSITNNAPYKYIKNAIVTVYKGQEQLETLALVSPDSTQKFSPFYRSSQFTPEFNTEYTIKVDVEGYETITAKTSIPTPVNLDTVTFEPNLTDGEDGEDVVVNFEVSVSLNDPAAVNNYYHLKFYQELIEYQISPEGDTIFGETFLKYPSQIEQVNEIGNALKYFSEQSYLIEDSWFNGRFVKLDFRGEYSFDPSKTKPGRFLVEFRTVSKDYYLYFKSANLQSLNDNPVGEDVYVYSNVDNGLGNFSGFTSNTNSFKLTD